MAQRADAFRSGRFYLPTVNLTDPTTKFGNITPALNNNYDVMINFAGNSRLRNFINQHGFFDQNGGTFNPGEYLALFCSEAVLPGSDIQSGKVDGLRQGLSQNFATFRRFPDVILTFYSQTDYYTNEVFNAWMEFISPTRIADGTFGASTEERINHSAGAAFRRMQYPKTYKCNIEITAFSKDNIDDFNKLSKTSRFNLQLPSAITYHIINAFPTSIVAAPLAYGRAELIKTTITFNYEQYFTQRAARKGAIYAESDATSENIRNPDAKVKDNESKSSNKNINFKKDKLSTKKLRQSEPFTREQILDTQNEFVREGF